MLVLLPEEDEYRDRPMREIAAWFAKEHRSKRFGLEIFKGADHSFAGAEKAVAKTIREWISG
jgi:dienelactone hydrolase